MGQAIKRWQPGSRAPESWQRRTGNLNPLGGSRLSRLLERIRARSVGTQRHGQIHRQVFSSGGAAWRGDGESESGPLARPHFQLHRPRHGTYFGIVILINSRLEGTRADWIFGSQAKFHRNRRTRRERVEVENGLGSRPAELPPLAPFLCGG